MCPNCRRNFLYYKRALLCCTKVDRKFTYVCEVCATVINSKQNVQRHKKRCANIMKARKAEKSIETPNLCELCDKTFSTHTTLKRHKHEVHKLEKEPGDLICDQCSYKCNIESIMKNHQTKRHSSKKYDCDQCDSKFYSYSGLKKHRIAQHNPKTFKCKQCTKYYSCKEQLILHLERHHKDGIDESDNESEDESEYELESQRDTQNDSGEEIEGNNQSAKECEFEQRESVQISVGTGVSKNLKKLAK